MRKKLFFASLIVFSACSEDGTGPGDDPQLTLSSDSLSVQVGASTVVTASVAPAGGVAQFISRDNTIATVDANGAITGHRVGRTVVVGSLIGNPSVRDSLIVAVVAAQSSGQPVQLPLLGTGMVPERFTAEVAASGTVAYTTTWANRNGVQGNALKIWNVAAAVPVLVDSIVLPGVGTISDVQISDDGNLLVISLESSGQSANNGLAIYNRSNATQPTLLRRYSSANTAAGVHTVKLGRVNGRLYAFLSVNSPRLVILDLNDPANPVEVFSQTMGDPFIHDVFIRDGILFTGLWHTGVRIFDVGGGGRGGSPSNPIVLGTVKTAPCKSCAPGTSSAHNIWWFHDPLTGQKKYAFVGEEGPGSVGAQASRGAIHVIDVNNFADPKEVAVYEPDVATTANQQNAGAHNFVMDEPSGILYAAYYNAGVRALDVRGDLSACTIAQKTPDGRCDLLLMGREVGVAVSSGPPKYIWGVALVGTTLYASDMPNGLHKINVSALKR